MGINLSMRLEFDCYFGQAIFPKLAGNWELECSQFNQTCSKKYALIKGSYSCILFRSINIEHTICLNSRTPLRGNGKTGSLQRSNFLCPRLLGCTTERKIIKLPSHPDWRLRSLINASTFVCSSCTVARADIARGITTMSTTALSLSNPIFSSVLREINAL